MDLILGVKEVNSSENCTMLDFAVCDRKYNILYNETFTYKFMCEDKWEPTFESRKRELLKSILHGNKVVTYGNKPDAIRILILLYEEAGMDYQWLKVLKTERCKEKAFDHYEPLRSLIGMSYSELGDSLDFEEFDLDRATKFSFYENDNLELNVFEPQRFYDVPCIGVLHHCLDIAFVYNVIDASSKWKAA